MTEKLMQMEVDVSVSGPAGDGGGDSREEAARTPVRTGNPKPGSDEPSPASDDTPDSTRPRAESFTSDRGGSGGNNNNNKKKHRRGKHKGGRRHRHWKPYTKMTWDEKKELEERETRRAYQKREQRFASGQPMAPYNTTQFLMEQHPPSDVNLCDSSRPRLTKSEAGGGGDGSGGASGSADGSSDEYYSSPDDEEIFLEKEFTEAYENYHAERLQTMSKDELVREYLELESKVELMEKKTKQEQGQTPNGRLSSSATTEEGGFPSPTPRQNGQEDKSSPTTTTTETPKDKVTGTTPPGSRRQPQEAATAKLSSLEEEIHKLRQENEKLRQENEQLRRTNVSNSVNEGEP